MIDENLIEDTSHVYGLMTCIKKSYCNGICSLNSNIFNEIFKEIGIIKADDSFHFGIMKYHIERLNIIAPEIFNSIQSNYVEINVEKLIHSYKKSIINVHKVCSVYSIEATVIELRKLPEVITLKIKSMFGDSSTDESDEDYDEDFQSEEVKNHKSSTDDEIEIKISPKQLDELAVKFADEIEIRLRKLLLEFK